jgi:ADP-heptose:LPS heptosyltransferase
VQIYAWRLSGVDGGNMTGGGRILVIKLGALGDVVQAGGPFAAIRRHHPADHIVLLTTEPFVPLLEQSPWFDEIWIDDRPKVWHWRRLQRLKQRVADAGFDRVYDLQTSDRSGFYYRLVAPDTEWSGIVSGASHRHEHPNRKNMHTIERQIDQLAVAGVKDVPFADFSWLHADISEFALPRDHVLLVPGGSAHRPEKRWPVEHYASLCWNLVQRGITPVALGGPDETDIGRHLVETCHEVIDLVGKTSLPQIHALAVGCRCAVGNDTGPIHLIAAAGAPVTALFSAASDPALCAPRGPQDGPKITILRREPLAGLSVNEVEATLTLR